MNLLSGGFLFELVSGKTNNFLKEFVPCNTILKLRNSNNHENGCSLRSSMGG